jgi:HK97 family phage prohead protease/HK97 family phage major capsid protein
MVDKNKILYLDNVFTKELPTADEKVDSIYIEGYASTQDVDRHGDVIPPSVWEAGLVNYLKNPVILAYHDHDDPCGRMTDHRIDEKGLWIKARISAAAEVFNLVKDGVVTAFSVGFRIKDAEYNAAAEVFMVKELELHEISVVAVPANQNTLFNLSKSFETDEEYKSFKMQFAPKGESAKGLESTTEAESTNIIKEIGMTQEEMKKMLADAAKEAAEQAAKALAEKAAEEAAQKAAAAKAEAELDARIKAAVAAVAAPSETGAEKLLAEVEKRFAEHSDSTKSVIAGLEAALKEKAAEIEAIQKSKMQFQDGKNGDMSYADKEKAVLLAKMAGKALDGTKFGRDMVQKFGAHLPSQTWETEVSLNMENEVRRRLVVAPTLRNVSMQTNVMTIPVNPEAGVATWMANTAFGTSASAGATQTHALKEITLNAYKVATNEYMAYEEEEDSLIVLLPIVRDAMVRRVARAVDRAFLLGAGTGSDPVKGLATYDAVADVTPSAASGVVTIANLRAMRKSLGAWGLDPSEMVYVVSTEVYYDLLEDSTFQTMDKVGTQATLLTGQVGSIGNTPVLVSAEFASKASGTVGAIAYAPGNFLVGNQRGLRVDTQELVETQRRVMVASLRTGMTQVTTNLGAGVSKLVYAA